MHHSIKVVFPVVIHMESANQTRLIQEIVETFLVFLFSEGEKKRKQR